MTFHMTHYVTLLSFKIITGPFFRTIFTGKDKMFFFFLQFVWANIIYTHVKFRSLAFIVL